MPNRSRIIFLYISFKLYFRVRGKITNNVRIRLTKGVHGLKISGRYNFYLHNPNYPSEEGENCRIINRLRVIYYVAYKNTFIEALFGLLLSKFTIELFLYQQFFRNKFHLNINFSQRFALICLSFEFIHFIDVPNYFFMKKIKIHGLSTNGIQSTLIVPRISSMAPIS